VQEGATVRLGGGMMADAMEPELLDVTGNQLIEHVESFPGVAELIALCEMIEGLSQEGRAEESQTVDSAVLASR
jgi:hypothetical protein